MLSNPLLLRPFGQVYSKEGASLLAQSVKNLPPVAGDMSLIPGQEELLEKGMAIPF